MWASPETDLVRSHLKLRFRLAEKRRCERVISREHAWKNEVFTKQKNLQRPVSELEKNRTGLLESVVEDNKTHSEWPALRIVAESYLPPGVLAH